MLIAKTTKTLAGMEVFGDRYDLASLHGTIHHLCDSADNAHEEAEDFVLGLAYEVRHALQGDRWKKQFGPNEFGDKVTYSGFKMVLPQFLSCQSLLRGLAAFCDTTTRHQSDLLILDACTHEALNQMDRNIGAKCIEICHSLSSIVGQPDYLFEHVNSCCLDYIELGTKKRRLAALENILSSFHVLSPAYQSAREQMTAYARKHNCDVKDLSDSREWPEIKW